MVLDIKKVIDIGGIKGFTENSGQKYYVQSSYKENPCPWTKAWKEYFILLKQFILSDLLHHIGNQNTILDCGGGTTYSKFKEESKQIATFLKSISTFVLIETARDDKLAVKKIYKRELERIKLAKEGKKAYVMLDLTDRPVYKKVYEDYHKRIHGFRKQADITIYNDTHLEHVCSQLILKLKQKNII